MFYQSSVRNQRAKSSKVKRILQFALLFGVSLWLLYQMKHSHDKKAEFEEVDRRRISQLDGELYLGRKGKAGYESELEIDSHEKNFDEINEISKTDEDSGAQPDIFYHDGGDKDGENVSNKENEVSQEGAEREEEQHSSEYDKADSHSNGGDEVAGNGTSEETEETLKMPSQDEDGINYSDQNENSNEVDSHDGQNFNTDGENSDDAAGKASNKENAFSLAGQVENVSLPEDQSRLDVSSNEEVHVGEESGESQGSNDSESEVTNKRMDEEVDAGASNNKQPTEVNPSEENNPMPTFNDTSNEQTIEPQQDNVNANSENENHKVKTAEPQSDNNSDVVTTVNDLSGEAKTGDENNVEMATKDGALDSKLVEPEGNNDVNAIAEVATNNGDNKEEDRSASKEGDITEKVGENASEVENVRGSSSNEPENNEITNTEDSSSSHSNGEDISERKSNESSNGGAGENGDGVSTLEDTNDNNAEEIKTEWKPEDETSSESGGSMPLSGDNVKEGTGQEGHTE